MGLSRIYQSRGWFELFFVNTVGLPYNTGLFIYLALLVVYCMDSLESMKDNPHSKRVKTTSY